MSLCVKTQGRAGIPQQPQNTPQINLFDKFRLLLHQLLSAMCCQHLFLNFQLLISLSPAFTHISASPLPISSHLTHLPITINRSFQFSLTHCIHNRLSSRHRARTEEKKQYTGRACNCRVSAFVPRGVTMCVSDLHKKRFR